MIGAVTVLPAMLALVTAASAGARRAFLWIVLPSLLLLPNYYVWKLPGIPRFDFHNYLLLVAVGGFVWTRRGLPRFHPIDLLLVLYVVLVTGSELSNKAFGEARNLWALTCMGMVAPYLLGKWLAEDPRLLVSTCAVLVLVGAFVGAASVYEARMGANPFDFWRSRWAGPVPWDGALYRAGIRRVAGPFAHPICHGFFFSMAVPIGCWLVKDKLAAGRVSKLCVVGALILGLLASVSRGPMMGLAIALLITLFGWSRNRTLFLVVGGLAGLFALALAYPAVQSYLTVDRGEAVTATQETAAYRNEMLQNYLEVVRERPWLGFGKDEIPIVKGQKSIDNQYLFLALTHGLPAAVVFLGLMVVPIVAALCQLLQRRRSTPIERLRWVLTGVLAGAVFTQVTVFSGTQTTQVLLLLEGLTVGLLGSVSQRYPGVLRGSI